MINEQPTTDTVSIADLREVVRVAVERHPDARSRIERGAMIIALRTIRPDEHFLCVFHVESESRQGASYEVDDGVGFCPCVDHRERDVRCKHMWSLRLLAAISRLKDMRAAEARDLVSVA